MSNFTVNIFKAVHLLILLDIFLRLLPLYEIIFNMRNLGNGGVYYERPEVLNVLLNVLVRSLHGKSPNIWADFIQLSGDAINLRGSVWVPVEQT